MDNKVIRVYRILRNDFEAKIKPFKFNDETIYYISDNFSSFNLSYTSPNSVHSDYLSLSLKRKGYNFIYLTGNNVSNQGDLARIYQYYEPSRIFLNKNNHYQYAYLLLQFLGIEDKVKDVFIYFYENTLFVILVPDSQNTREVIDEVIQFFPDIDVNVLYAPFPFNLINSEDYIELDDETKKCVDDIFDNLDKLNKSGQFLAILPYIEEQISITKNQIVPELSFLYIDEHYRIFLTDYGNKEIKMSHLTKALYFLFLLNEEIDLEKINKLKNELFVIYKNISNQENLEKMQESISLLLRNENNELYVHFSRIKSAFCKVIDQSIANNYYIKGAKLKPKYISLNLELTNIYDIYNVWFPGRLMPRTLKYFANIIGVSKK